MINKLVIIGVGLIGGSFGLALRKAALVKHITGVGRSQENMQRALKLGAIDEIAADLPSALKNADIVFLAIPVGQTAEIMAQISPYLEADTIVTDAGSTKRDVITAARSHLAGHLKNFVPGHPVAGAEQSGAGAAHANLFRGKKVVLTPLEETSTKAIKRMTEFWEACGAQVFRMDARQHDKILASISHLPHVLAFTLMNHVSAVHPEDLPGSNDPLRSSDPLNFAGTGFRDFTRIAGSSPEMWRDICLANREALSSQIDAYQRELADIREMLARGDGKALERAFANAREARRQWLKNVS
ncbi:prephenate dehydrogenase/arogenate dehydrogenase family protein [Nitrosovibrio sp. Nv6]|uniref:prephenate dehydrogenase n=1 Tax=Nitrosovibrio sp. Nv6 TaxID=1855340 RepID=UPI0008AADA79|nr:prephenate dehydrogenase/arogenate dehydrogenase family protein [Nitrosovibrio sp. Nv6]SEO84671.1 prephenate dehydrogenase [Nitrosovibrio sp. Nv6]